MEEKFLHYIWQYNLYNPQKFILNTGEPVEIINPGEYNINAGPDFINAKIKIDKTIWAGNVEIHVNSSDWYKHNHHKNKAFNNIILHVVYNQDKEIYRNNLEVIPTIKINFYQSVYNNYKNLINTKEIIKCSSHLYKLDPFYIQFWLNKLTIKRLEDKTMQIKYLLKKNTNNWEETFYQHLAYSFGLKINAIPFQNIAISLPLKILAKHKYSLLQLEALLFGQAGFLKGKMGDSYYLQLYNEYHLLKQKYNLKPINSSLWKFLRLRPGSFPTIRIAQFADLIYKSSNLFSKIIETKSIKEFETLFRIKTSDYWENHYVFNKTSAKRIKTLGKATFYTIMINSIIPILFTYSKAKNLPAITNKSIELLESLPPEKNSVIKKWSVLKINSSSAYTTQAILELNNNYCKLKKCLDCQIGHSLLSKNLISF
ncbi:MAG: DUF2851 family protein [Chlorobi bacterium]|nr:DUF2851 family protein [Chlorobiota bacterium]